MKKMFPLGCAGLGIQASSFEHPVSLNEPSIAEKFELLQKAELWDFIDHIPLHADFIDDYIQGSQKTGIPIYSGYGCYVWGNHETEFKVPSRRNRIRTRSLSNGLWRSIGHYR
mgnify:CR=1 FL=1